MNRLKCKDVQIGNVQELDYPVIYKLGKVYGDDYVLVYFTNNKLSSYYKHCFVTEPVKTTSTHPMSLRVCLLSFYHFTCVTWTVHLADLGLTFDMYPLYNKFRYGDFFI